MVVMVVMVVLAQDGRLNAHTLFAPRQGINEMTGTAAVHHISSISSSI